MTGRENIFSDCLTGGLF